MEIIIKELRMQFKNPILGQPTRPIEAHYVGRRIFAIVDGVDKHMTFTKEELSMTVTEEEIINAIKYRIQQEQDDKSTAE